MWHFYASILDRDPGAGKKGGGGLAAYTTKSRDFEFLDGWEASERNIEAFWLKLKL